MTSSSRTATRPQQLRALVAFLLAATIISHTMKHVAVAGAVMPFQEVTLASTLSGFQSLSLVDINGDGNLDLLFADGKVNIYIATDGVGGVAPLPLPTSPIFARSPSAVDIDSDGDLDLVWCWASTGSAHGVWWAENLTPRWDGTAGVPTVVFGDSALLFAANGVTEVAFGDMNGDGFVDMALPGEVGTSAARWLEVHPRVNASGAGGPTLILHSIPVAPAVTQTSPLGLTACLQVADLDGDGVRDLVGVAHGGALHWLRGIDGRGAFAAEQVLITRPLLGQAYLLADLDGDGDLDVACDHSLSHTVDEPSAENVWYANVDGRGSLELRQVFPLEAGDDWLAFGLAAADMDGDGDVDLVSTRGGQQLTWFENTDGRGNFSVRAPVVSESVLLCLATGDFDADGDIDLVTANSVTYVITLHRNLDPTFAFRRTPETPLAVAPSDFKYTVEGVVRTHLVDLTGRDLLDVVVITSAPTSTLLWLEHQNATSFVPHVLYELPPAAAFVFTAFADVNRDGRVDVVCSYTVTSAGNSEELSYEIIAVLLNVPDPVAAAGADVGEAGARFELTQTLSNRSALSASVRTLLLTDVDGDGYPDLLSTSATRGSVELFTNGGPSAPPGAQFQSGSSVASIVSEITHLLAADINGDGAVDMIAMDAHDNAILTAASDYGDWDGWTVVCLVPDPISVSAADVDGDGDVDIVVVSRGDGSVSWCENGLPTTTDFKARRVIAAGLAHPTDVWVADLDGDTDLDIAVVLASGALVWFETLDDSMATRARAAVPLAPAPNAAALGLCTLSVADITHDGRADVLRVCSFAAFVFVDSNYFAPPSVPVTVAAGTATNDTGGVIAVETPGDDAACLDDIRSPCATLRGALLANRRWNRGAPVLRLAGAPGAASSSIVVRDSGVDLGPLCRTTRQLLRVEVHTSGTSELRLVMNMTIPSSAGVSVTLDFAPATDETSLTLPLRKMMVLGGRLALVLAHPAPDGRTTSPIALLVLLRAQLSLSGVRRTVCGSSGQWRCSASDVVRGERATFLQGSAAFRFESCGAACSSGALFAKRSMVQVSDLEIHGFYSTSSAMLLNSCVAPTELSRVRFSENVGGFGGALSVVDSAVAVSSCQFDSNRAESGGAIAVGGLSEVKIREGVVFRRNCANGTSVSAGGAMLIQDRSALVLFFGLTHFEDNYAAVDGGAVLLSLGTLNTFGDVTFQGNHAGKRGGAVLVHLGTLATQAPFVGRNNTASDSGGFLACVGSLDAQLGLVSMPDGALEAHQNRARSRGGAVYSRECNLALPAALFEGNSVGDRDAFPPVPDAPAIIGGGALSSSGDVLKLTDSRWFHNSAVSGGDGGAIWITPSVDGASAGDAFDSIEEDWNSAPHGGGGFVYLEKKAGVVFDPPLPTNSGGHSTALYGAMRASQWVELRALNITVSGVPQTSRVPLLGGLSIALFDAFGQLVVSEQHAILRVLTSQPRASVLGDVARVASDGVVTWTGSQLAVQGVPGTTVPISITPIGSDVPLTSISVIIHLRDCVAGERIAPDGLSCALCPAGSYTNRSRSLTCMACPQHTHARAAGASECVACASREFTEHTGSVECLQCGSFHYARIDTNTTVGCEPCPAHVDCIHDDEVVALAGYWLSKNTRGFVSVVPCGAFRCIGGGQCAAGRAPPEANVLCGSCIDDYVEWDGKCVSCVHSSHTREAVLLMIIVAGTLALVLVFHVLSSKVRSSSRVKVFVFFVQAALLMLGSLSFESRTGLALFSIDPMRTLGLSCALRLSQFTRLMLGFSAPVLSLVALAVVAGLARAVGRPLVGLGATVAAMLVLTFVPIVSTGLEFFQCVRVPVGDDVRNVVFAYPEVRCDSREWRSSAVFAGAVLVMWLLVIPVTASIALSRWRQRRPQQSGGGPLGYGTSEAERNSAVAHAVAFVSAGYRSAAFFYEFVVLARRAALLAINILLANASQQSVRLPASALLMIACAVLHSVLQPFKRDEENRAEAFSLVSLCVLPIVMMTTEVPLSGPSGLAVVLTLVVLPAVVLFAWVVRGFIAERTAAAAAEVSKDSFDRVGWTGVELNEPLLIERRVADDEALG